jgi:hypothetical protein
MAITINGNGTITGVSVGGLPDGIVDTDMLAAGAATQAKRTYATGEAVQVVYAEMSSDFGMNSTTETDVGGMTASITLKNASNNILVDLTFSPYVAGAGACQYKTRVYRDTTELYANGNGFYRTGDDLKSTSSTIRFLDTGVSDTNSHTYKMTAQRTSGDDGFSIYASSTLINAITLTEIAT